MGLDMYLTRHHWVKNYDVAPDAPRWKVVVEKDGALVPYIKSERVEYVIEEIGYWRKANAIHRWFVETVQEGIDDCAEYAVARYQLAELLERCTKVLAVSTLVNGKVVTGHRSTETGWEPIVEDGEYIADPAVAQELLPTQEGFFFGGTDYDAYYLTDIQDTKTMLEAILAEPDEGTIHYQSSW